MRLGSFVAIATIWAAGSAVRAATDGEAGAGSLSWSVRMADSIMARQPKAILIENANNGPPKWSYSAAFCVRAVTQVGIGKGAGGEKYIQYGQEYINKFIDDKGVIGRAYDARGYRLDDVAPGQLLLLLFSELKETKYETAAKQLAEQLKTQPRVPEGGFWHKQIYPHQMWLDGIFMDCPFMARLGAMTDQPACFDEAAKQIALMAQHAQDAKTGLCYHGWDESKSEKWADPVTGLSKCFWGRGMGWYMAGIVETLDYLPADHAKRIEIIDILRKAAAGVEGVQDGKSGLWWQVLDQGDRVGNYHESSASCMFVYVLAKAARKGYIDAHFAAVAKRGYSGVLNELVSVDAKGQVTLKDTCQVAGLGGTPYRDGSYEYYLREPRVVNDPKGMAPFILASQEIELASH
jgi:unsaturated rhamnogalacturonyl hydrolase